VDEIQVSHRFRYVTGFLAVERSGLPFAHRTKAAVARADVTAEHECRRAIRPAFKDVGATRLLADRVKIQTFDQPQHIVLVGGIAQANPEPVRLWLTGLARPWSVANDV
jgi:hypothetical protein